MRPKTSTIPKRRNASILEILVRLVLRKHRAGRLESPKETKRDEKTQIKMNYLFSIAISTFWLLPFFSAVFKKTSLYFRVFRVFFVFRGDAWLEVLWAGTHISSARLLGTLGTPHAHAK